jgi:hypothetical protein
MGCRGCFRRVAYLVDTDEHVIDEGLEGAHRASVLVGAVPHADSNPHTFSLLLILFHHLEFAGDVGEVLSQLTLSTLNSDLTGLDFDFHCTKIVSLFSSYRPWGPEATQPSTIASFCLYLLY